MSKLDQKIQKKVPEIADQIADDVRWFPKPPENLEEIASSWRKFGWCSRTRVVLHAEVKLHVASGHIEARECGHT